MRQSDVVLRHRSRQDSRTILRAYVHVTGFILAWPAISRLGGELGLCTFDMNFIPWLSWDFVLFWCGLSLFSR